MLDHLRHSHPISSVHVSPVMTKWGCVVFHNCICIIWSVPLITSCCVYGYFYILQYFLHSKHSRWIDCGLQKIMLCFWVSQFTIPWSVCFIQNTVGFLQKDELLTMQISCFELNPICWDITCTSHLPFRPNALCMAYFTNIFITTLSTAEVYGIKEY